VQGAKEEKKRRIIEKMIMRVRKDLEIQKRSKRREGGRIKYGKDSLRIIGIYRMMNRDIEKKLNELKEWLEEREEGVKTIIGEDFNAWTGRERR